MGLKGNTLPLKFSDKFSQMLFFFSLFFFFKHLCYHLEENIMFIT